MAQSSRALAAWAAMGLALASSAALGNAGTLVTVTGAVSVERDGQKLAATEGFALREGDTVVTGEGAKAQALFQDDSIFAVPQDSALKVEQFRKPSKSAGTTGGSAIFSLLRGGFRTITGLIGKGNKDTYEIRTPVATMGVRGTTYAALLCADKCTATGKYRSGLYVKSESGIVIVSNAGGTLQVRAGQVAFVEASGVAPIIVTISPFDFAALRLDLSIAVDFRTEIHPERIEAEDPGSP